MGRVWRLVLLPSLVVFGLAACGSLERAAEDCPVEGPPPVGCPAPPAIGDPEIDAWYRERRADYAQQHDLDPIELGVQAKIPVQSVRLKLLGTSRRDALYSLAAKLHVIDNARHSVDAAYYIFKDDLVGRALLGALCEAVQRGVDVRLLVDSVGSISIDKRLFKALYQCQLQAGFIRNPEGQLTHYRARVQVGTFNAVSRLSSNVNRRSHDKLLVVDGFVREHGIVITGGRNISLDYYGIHADGSINDDTYLDAELLLRPGPGENGQTSVSEVAEVYFSLLQNFPHNRPIEPRIASDRQTRFPRLEQDLKEAAAELRALPGVAAALGEMPAYLKQGFHSGEVRLAHEFANLVNERVITQAVANLENNPNSITYLLSMSEAADDRYVRIVSPYLFAARYYGPDGEVLLDEAQAIRDFLEENPRRTYEIVTNSVLTSDNFFAQAVVDMDMAPRLLLDDAHRERWQGSRREGEASPELVDTDTWRELVENPRLRIYEVGKLDDVTLGGEVDYGKLHGKYILTNKMGFLGTSNFDYRSRLFNNEMGFFFVSEGLAAAVNADFERLKRKSYLWGSPDWLEMRRRLVDQGGMKGWTTRHQSTLFRFLRATGLKWYF